MQKTKLPGPGPLAADSLHAARTSEACGGDARGWGPRSGQRLDFGKPGGNLAFIPMKVKPTGCCKQWSAQVELPF